MAKLNEQIHLFHFPNCFVKKTGLQFMGIKFTREWISASILQNGLQSGVPECKLFG